MTCEDNDDLDACLDDDRSIRELVFAVLLTVLFGEGGNSGTSRNAYFPSNSVANEFWLRTKLFSTTKK